MRPVCELGFGVWAEAMGIHTLITSKSQEETSYFLVGDKLRLLHLSNQRLLLMRRSLHDLTILLLEAFDHAGGRWARGSVSSSASGSANRGAFS